MSTQPHLQLIDFRRTASALPPAAAWQVYELIKLAFASYEHKTAPEAFDVFAREEVFADVREALGL